MLTWLKSLFSPEKTKDDVLVLKEIAKEVKKQEPAKKTSAKKPATKRGRPRKTTKKE
jgi:hypothetical protein